MLLGLKGHQVGSSVRYRHLPSMIKSQRTSACLLRALKPFLGTMRRMLTVVAMQSKLEIISHVTCLHPDIDEGRVACPRDRWLYSGVGRR